MVHRRRKTRQGELNATGRLTACAVCGGQHAHYSLVVDFGELEDFSQWVQIVCWHVARVRHAGT